MIYSKLIETVCPSGMKTSRCKKSMISGRRKIMRQSFYCMPNEMQMNLSKIEGK